MFRKEMILEVGRILNLAGWIMKPPNFGGKNLKKNTWVATTWQPFVTSDLDFSGHFWLRTLKFPHGRLLWIQTLIPGDSSRGLSIPNLEVTNNLWVRVTNHHPKKGLVESPGGFTLESRTLRLSCRCVFPWFPYVTTWKIYNYHGLFWMLPPPIAWILLLV